MIILTEADVEQAALAWLESLGWSIAHGSDIAAETLDAECSDYGQVVLERQLRDALAKLDPALPADASDDAFHNLNRPKGTSPETHNRAFHRIVVDGITVKHRPDAMLFVNGLPLRVIELKNPADEDAMIWTAWQQLQTYTAELPTLFSMNEVLIVSDGTQVRIGTLTAGREWFKPWHMISGELRAENTLKISEVAR